MEEKAVSPEYVEEVLDLLDIVQPAETPRAEADEIIELSLDDIAAPAANGEELLELVDVIGREDGAEQGSDEILLTERLVLPGEEAPAGADPVPAPQAVEPAPSFIEEAAFERFAAEVEDRFTALEKRQEEDVQAMLTSLGEAEQLSAARLDALRAELPSQEDSASELQNALQRLSALEEKYASGLQAFDERLAALEEKHTAEVQALEARLAAAEERASALAAEADGLRQALNDIPSHFFDDSLCRQALEEQFAPVIEGRLAQFAEERSAKEEGRAALLASSEETALLLKKLEARVDDWESRCEQEASLAAARVIREEIAAMRAGAARMQH